MSKSLVSRSLRSRPARRAATAAVATVVAAAVGVGGYTVANATQPERGTPAMTEQMIPNLGQVKTQIQQYYGDDGKTHEPSPDSSYAKEVGRDIHRARAYLWMELGTHQSVTPATTRANATDAGLVGNPARWGHGDGKPAIVVDVDDTTLNTYNYEATHDFGYDPQQNADYIHNHGMGPVFGMPELLQWASASGAQVFFLTGRPEAQRADTLRDLGKAGYPDVADGNLFLRNKTAPPDYLKYCEPTCTTIQYKSSTREHLESLGYDIVLNMGDQYSDLKGGHADHAVKLPNPMYYLP